MGSYPPLPYCKECLVKTCETNDPITMSYYHRFMTGMYRSYWPHLNRSLRSCSAPRHVPEPVPSRITRAASTPFYSSTYTPTTPRYERAVSVPRQLTYSYDTRCIVTPPPATQYSNFDYKVMDYMGKLDREDTIRSNINTTRVTKTTSSSYSGSTNSHSYSYSSTANQYQSDNYSRDNYSGGNYSGGNYSSADILGSWKHYNLSGATLNSRTTRAKSPLLDRELIRYYGKKPNYMGDVSSGAACDFRHYNYRRVPYFGGSDDYQFIRRKEYRGGRCT